MQCRFLLFEEHKEWLNVPFVPLACCTCCLFARRLWIEQMKTMHLYMNRRSVQTGSPESLHAPGKKCPAQSKALKWKKERKKWTLGTPSSGFVVERQLAKLVKDNYEREAERWHSNWINCRLPTLRKKKEKKERLCTTCGAYACNFEVGVTD